MQRRIFIFALDQLYAPCQKDIDNIVHLCYILLIIIYSNRGVSYVNFYSIRSRCACMCEKREENNLEAIHTMLSSDIATHLHDILRISSEKNIFTSVLSGCQLSDMSRGLGAIFFRRSINIFSVIVAQRRATSPFYTTEIRIPTLGGGSGIPGPESY